MDPRNQRDDDDNNQHDDNEYDENQDNYEDGQDNEEYDQYQEDNDYNGQPGEVNGDNEEQEASEAVPNPVEDEPDDDFPEYANEHNKQLNQIIKEKRKLIKELQTKIEDVNERSKVLKDHLKNVRTELINTQQLIDDKNKEIETEDHLKQLNERQIGRLRAALRKLEEQEVGKQERLNDIQNQIFKCNEKMEQHKLEMNYNQEELEQWSLAAKQKEEDNLALEKYRRQDDIKVKELNLEIEKLTTMLTRKQNELDQEITETQAAQIELDKTAEEFKKHHEERHKLFQQWEDALQTISRREETINQEADKYAQIKMEIEASKNLLEEKKNFNESLKGENKRTELEIQSAERTNYQKKEVNKQKAETINNLSAEVEILKNQLSAFASDLQQKKNKASALHEELLRKKQRLNNAEKKFTVQKSKLLNADDLVKELIGKSKSAEDVLKDAEKSKSDLEREVRIKEDQLFKATQNLFKLREEEANLYGEIQGNMAACRNLQAHINKLSQEFQRQQELLYNAEYQIQLMERKVARARGEKTIEEKKELEEQIKKAEAEFEKKAAEHKTLSQALRRLDDDTRAIEKQLVSVEEEKAKLSSTIEELTLENDMFALDLSKIVKTKEETLVQHDVMKLEIKNIRDNLMKATYRVYNLENRKHQLEMSMQEREKEISVHKDVLKAEYKAAEEERHKIAVELSERLNKVKNLKIKYEALVQKKQSSDGIEDINEHSQAYYVIKAAQEREELQRKGDELNAKIIQSEKELKALDNTLNHLKNRNSDFRDGFLNKGRTDKDVEQKNALEQQMNAASENYFKKKKEFASKTRDYEEDLRRYNELQNRLTYITQRKNEAELQARKLAEELKEQEQKKGRAERTLNEKKKLLASKNKTLQEDSVESIQINLDIEKNLTKTLQSGIFILFTEYPELREVLEPMLKERNIPLPEKAPSAIDVASSHHSVSSRGSAASRGRLY